MVAHNEKEILEQTAGLLEYMHRAQSRPRTNPKKVDSYRVRLQELDAKLLDIELSKRIKEVYE